MKFPLKFDIEKSGEKKRKEKERISLINDRSLKVSQLSSPIRSGNIKESA